MCTYTKPWARFLIASSPSSPGPISSNVEGAGRVLREKLSGDRLKLLTARIEFDSSQFCSMAGAVSFLIWKPHNTQSAQDRNVGGLRFGSPGNPLVSPTFINNPPGIEPCMLVHVRVLSNWLSVIVGLVAVKLKVGKFTLKLVRAYAAEKLVDIGTAFES